LENPVTTTTTEAPKTGGFVVGEEAQYFLGLKGTVTAIDDGTVTIEGVTVPTRLVPGVTHLSDLQPSAPVEPDHSECVPEDDYNGAEADAQRFRDGIEKLHEENHPGVFAVCLHEVCRRAGGRW
jgi:hypothetical protein